MLEISSVYPSDFAREAIADLEESQIRAFFNTIAHNSHPLKQSDFGMSALLAEPGIANELNDYLDFFIENGMYNEFIEFVLIRFPRLDESAADEMTLFAIWESFFIIPWNESGIGFKTIKKYILVLLKQAGKAYSWRYGTSGKCQIDNCPSLPSDDLSPEQAMINKDSLSDLIGVLLSVAIAENDRNFSTKKSILYLLALGYSLTEIVKDERISLASAKSAIRRFKKCGIIDDSNRVDTRSNQSWNWSAKTARVLLNEPFVVQMLTDDEKHFLYALEKFASISMVVSKGLFVSNNSNLARSILHKVRSGGDSSRNADTSIIAQRRFLLLFLQGVEAFNEAENIFLDALFQSRGNQMEAAKQLGVPQNKITNFLARKGYYLR